MVANLALTLLGAATSIGAPVWWTDFGKAQERARTEGKVLLINFSGSDWCGWCMKLRKDVFQTPLFGAYAQSNLVLLEVDFPKRKVLAPAQEKANRQLAQQLEVKGFPTIILFNNKGGRIGTVDYANGGPRAFIAELEKTLRPAADAPASPTRVKRPATPQRLKKASTTKPDNSTKSVSGRIAASN